MIRTNVVDLTTIDAVAYRHKLPSGGSGITILRYDQQQPGIASISTKTGEPILSTNTNPKNFPLEAFEEAMELTRGMNYKKQGSIKLKKKEIVEEEVVEEEVIVNEDEYQAIVAYYTDKNGNFSYDLMNKDMIQFAHSSKKVKEMIEEAKPVGRIREYIITSKFITITGNHDLTKKEALALADKLDELYPKSAFKELTEDLRRSLSKNKKK